MSRDKKIPPTGDRKTASLQSSNERLLSDMKYLAIDYGEKRTGLAVSDPGGTCCFPKKTLQMRGKDVFFAELLTLVDAEGIEAIVIGLPLNSLGQETETTRIVRNMAARLHRRCPLPIYFMEEYLSSAEAEKRLKDIGTKPKEMSLLIDQYAAAIILESFIRLPEEHRQALAYSS